MLVSLIISCLCCSLVSLFILCVFLFCFDPVLLLPLLGCLTALALYPWRSTWISSLVVRPSTKVLRSLCPLVVWAQTQARFFVRWGRRKHHEIFLIEIHIKSSETFVISALFNYVPAVAKSKHEYWYQLVHQGYYEFLMTRFWFALWENETAFWIWICVGKSSRRCLIGKYIF